MAQDLGHLLGANPLTAGSSMAGGNTISARTESMTSPGSPSEMTGGAPQEEAISARPSYPEQPVGTPVPRKVVTSASATRPQRDPDSGSWKMTAVTSFTSGPGSKSTGAE